MSSNKYTFAAAVPFAAALAILGISCYVQGMWSERWGTFPELKLYAEQLTKIPLEFGEWKGTEAEKSDSKILKIAGAEGELVRRYKNPSGDEVRVSIICARLQDIFNHSPDRCYPAAGFEMEGSPTPEAIDSGSSTAEFFTTNFTKSEPTGTHRERGYWSWSAGDKWIAPKNAKLAFAGQKAIYKLYVFANIPVGKQKSTDRDFHRDFIRAFIPVLEESLRPAFETSQGVRASASQPAAPATAAPKTEG